MRLGLCLSLLAVTLLSGCANTIPAGFQNIYGQTWTYTTELYLKPNMVENSDRVLKDARDFCATRGLLLMPGDLVRETAADGKHETLKLDFRCRQATGYKTPYEGFFLHFNGDEKEHQKK